MDSIKVVIYKPETLDEIKESYTAALAKILSDKIPYNSLDNFINMIETIYADELFASECNIMRGEKNEYGSDLHKKV